MYLPELTFEAFPMLLMGGCALFGGVLSLLLPETLGAPLMEDLNEIDLLFENQKSFFTCWSKKKLKEEHHARTKEIDILRGQSK